MQYEARGVGKGAGQPELLLSFEPPLGVVLLALGAAAVLARVIAISDLVTMVAVKYMTTEGFGAALLNILHGTPMTGEGALSEL
jgi:hypothetical protein